MGTSYVPVPATWHTSAWRVASDFRSERVAARRQRSAMPTDASGQELSVGDRVVDSIFGEGVILGTVPLKVGAGLNMLVKWDSGRTTEEGGRSSEHLTKLAPRPKASTPPPRRTRRIISTTSTPSPSPCRKSPRLQELQAFVDANCARAEEVVPAVSVNHVRSSEASFMVNFFGRTTVKHGAGAASSMSSTAQTSSAVGASSTSKSAGKRPVGTVLAEVLPELAPHERARVVRQKKKRDEPEEQLEEPDAGAASVAESKVRRERGPNKAGRMTKQSHVLMSKRLKEFPDQALKVSAGRALQVLLPAIHHTILIDVSLCEYSGDLFCSCCSHVLPNISSSIRVHIKSSRHQKKLLELERATQAGKQLSTDLASYFENNPTESMASLPTEVHVFRYSVTETFLASGTPLERLPFFRDLLEANGKLPLTDVSHLRAYIPKIESRELQKVKEELKESKFFSIAFDGTTRLGEAINIVGRFCNESFRLRTRLLRFLTTKQHTNHRQLASLISRTLCTEYGLDPDHLVGLSRDSVSTNGAACELLTDNPFIRADSMLCVSHTLNNCGKRLQLEVVEQFITPWLDLVGGRDPHRGAQALWKLTVHPQVVHGFSNVRWHAKAEILFVIAENFGRLQSFMKQLDERGYGEATRAKLHAIVDDPGQCRQLQLQLGALLDIRLLVKTTMELEGDRLELLLVHDRVEKLRSLGRSIRNGDDGALPNVDALLRSMAKIEKGTKILKPWPGLGTFAGVVNEGPFTVNSTLYPGKERPGFKVYYPSDKTSEDLEEDEIRSVLDIRGLPERATIIERLNPVFDYLESRITGNCQASYSCDHMYQICTAARCFNPAFAAQHLNAPMVDELAVISSLPHFVNFTNLKNELPFYLVAAKEFGPIPTDDVENFSKMVLTFWRHAPNDISSWKEAARLVFCLTPNSAACERVFSLLASMFDSAQDNAFADFLQASLLLRCNATKRKREVKEESKD